MRRTPTNVMAIALALAALGGGCKCGGGEEEKKDEEATSAEKREPGKELEPQAARRRSEALRRMQLAPVTVEEVEALIPALPGASPVGKPGVLTQGRQVKAVLCAVSPSAQTAMTQLVASLGALGFETPRTGSHPRNPDVATLHAEKKPYQLGATVQKTTTPDCPGDKGKIKIVLSYFKRVTTDATIPTPGQAPVPVPAPAQPPTP